MYAGFFWKDKAHLLRQIKRHSGVYSIKLPLTDEEIWKDIIVDDTIGTFSELFPRRYVLPVDLDQIRVPNARDNTSNDISDVYELPLLYPLNSGSCIFSIEKILPYRDMRYEAVTHAYQTIESFQALAVAQGVANLSSVMEPPMKFFFMGGRRFRLTNGSYYRNRVVIYINMMYNEELFDLQMSRRRSFAALAELDFRRDIYANTKYWNQLRTAAGEYELNTAIWESAEQQREDLLEYWRENFHFNHSILIV